MKKISVRGILLFFALSVCLVFLLWTYLVSDTGDRYVNGIYVSKLLRISSNRKYTANYCELLNKAIAKDANSIKQLTLLDFGDAASYDHGTVIVDLIDLIGEEKFIQSLGTINEKQKNKLSSYLIVGIEYGNNPNLQGKTVKEAFPKIYDFLN